MGIHSTAYEEPHWSIRLERESEEDATEQQVAEEMLKAVEVLATDWLEPLAMHLSIGCYDTEAFYAPSDCRPPQPQWFRRKATISPSVKACPIYVDPIIDIVPEFTSEGTRAWIAHALMQECPNTPRFIPSWRELWWPAVRVRVPESSHAGQRGALQVHSYAGTLSVPLEEASDATWVSGPLKHYVIGPPAELVAYNEDGVVAVQLRTYWSLWSDEPAGRALVDAAVDRVLDFGWGWRRRND